jgi:hypothetical protein
MKEIKVKITEDKEYKVCIEKGILTTNLNIQEVRDKIIALLKSEG